MYSVSRRFFFIISILVVFFYTPASVYAQVDPTPHEEAEGYSPGEMITHHIGDAYSWHFAELGTSHVGIPLPMILYSEDGQLDVFMSSRLDHGQVYRGYQIEGHGHLVNVEGKKFYDLSITKNVASMLLSAILLLLVFTAVASGYKKNGGKAPKGIQSFFEPIIVFIRDDIAKANIGPKYERYVPFLLTIFFFIWFNNLLGLVPGGANLTGNIAITLTLAAIVLIVVLFSSNKYYWQHIFNTPGVPWWLKWGIPIMPVVEVIGIFTKPFSLMVRLFANITAGHIIILSLFSLIFIFRSLAVGPVSVLFAIFMNMLELFVALLQAYIFTMLTSMYIGSAVEEHDHPDHGH
jgi:F-type H+-transporting ATPase subunit a